MIVNILNIMSLLSGIINGETPVVAKQLAHLLTMVKVMGWDGFRDTRTIKPNLRQAQLYLRRNAAILTTLFPGTDYSNIQKNDVVDVLNPFLIQMWHLQIIGDTAAASLQLLRPTH